MNDSKVIDSLEEGFRAKVNVLKVELLRQTGYSWYAVQGKRTIAEQDSLYAQGRTKPGKVVTKAKGGSSAHNFGLAVDLVPVNEEGKLWWEAPKTLWQRAADISKDLGFIPGFYFHTIFDPDHFEDPNWRAQQALWQQGKIEVV